MTQEIQVSRCDGWHRRGGAFTMGPVTWSQCSKVPDFHLRIDQGDGVEHFYCCVECFETSVDGKITVIEKVPMGGK